MPNAVRNSELRTFTSPTSKRLGATTDTTFQEWQTQETLSDTFSWNKGRHNLRIGGLAENC